MQDRLDDPDIDGILVNSRDITERQKQDDQFQQLAQEYRTLLRTVDDGIFSSTWGRSTASTSSRSNE